MAPPNLAFARTIRRASDVKLSFYPLSDPSMRQLVLPRAYIFLLTDLFLICSRLTPEERAATQGPDGEGPDMWLLYPPLAGKHLRVSEGRDEGELEIVVMKKERLSLRAESGRAAQEWKAAFEETIAFGMSRAYRFPIRVVAEIRCRRTQGQNRHESHHPRSLLRLDHHLGLPLRIDPLRSLPSTPRQQPGQFVWSVLAQL